jgi:hypothetical protein
MENKTSKNLWRSFNHTNSDEEELLKFQQMVNSGVSFVFISKI